MVMIKTLPITNARAEFTSLVDNAQKKFDQYIITVNGTPSAVLMSVQEYESLQETLDILSDPKLMKDIKEAEEDIKAGRIEDWDQVKKDLQWDV